MYLGSNTPPPYITLKQVSGPDAKQNGWYAEISATIDQNNKITFDAKDIPYFTKKDKKYGEGTFKGFWDNGTFNFDHVTTSKGSRRGIWSFTTSPSNPIDPNTPTINDPHNPFASIPEPNSTLSLLALGTLGAASTLKRKLKSSKSAEKEKV